MCKWGTVEILEYNNKRFEVDKCIVPLVKALNEAGIKTIASCCGHGKIHGNIALADGRELIIAKDYETAREYEQWEVTIEKLKAELEKWENMTAEEIGEMAAGM